MADDFQQASTASNTSASATAAESSGLDLCPESAHGDSLDEAPVSAQDAGDLYINEQPEPATPDADQQDVPIQLPLPLLSPHLPTFKIEINKKLYTVNSAHIAITTDGDAADIRLSVDIGSAATGSAGKRPGGSDMTEVVHNVKTSIKTSFKGTKRVIAGAANKILKQSRAVAMSAASTIASHDHRFQANQQLKLPAAPGADSDQLASADGACSQQHSSTDPADASGGLDAISPSVSIEAEGSKARRMTLSQDNTLESSDPTQAVDTPAGSKTSKTLRNLLKPLSRTSQPDPTAATKMGQSETVAAPVLFPDCVPEKLKILFQIIPETCRIATIYAADTLATASDVKQMKKTLIDDPAKRKIKVNGKSRSIWLSPTAGEKVEIWKLYYDRDNRCNMMLGRLPGSELYGYILPAEVDRDKQFDSPQEQTAYNKAIRSLTCEDEVYDDDEGSTREGEVEEVGEVYM